MSNRTIFLCLLIFSLNSINSVLIYAFRRSLTKYFKAQCSKKMSRGAIAWNARGIAEVEKQILFARPVFLEQAASGRVQTSARAMPAGHRARPEFRGGLRRIGGLLHGTDVLQFCRPARSHAKG